MLARATAALVVALAALPLAAAQAGSDAPELRALVRLPHGFSESLEVTLSSTGHAWTQLPDGSIVEFDPGETYRYTMPIERPVLAFALIRAAEILPLNVASVALETPEGWSGVRSSSVLAFGQGMHVGSHLAGEARVRLATMGEPTAADLAYASRGLAYLAAQHEEAPDDILIVRAPENGIEEAFVQDATLVLPSDAPEEELARLAARAHQRYRVVEVAPASAAWFREGEERLHEQMSLMAAGLRTSAQVDETFTRARAVAEPDARLPQAPAGSTLARQKGLVAVRALDAELRNASAGRAGLADLLAALDGTPGRLDSAAIEEAAVGLAGPRVADFFARYVYGEEWPATPGARDAADVFVRSIAVSSRAVDVGDPVEVEYALVNRGTQPGELDLVLRVDGAAARTLPVRLDVGASERASVVVTLATTGSHVLALGPRNATVHVRGPAELGLVRVASAPEEPREGVPFTLLVYVRNAGESTGRARVEVYEDGMLVQRTTEAFIDGGATDAVTLPVRLDAAGLHALEIRLVGEGVNGTLAHLVTVRAAPPKETPTFSAAGAIVLVAALAGLAGRVPRK